MLTTSSKKVKNSINIIRKSVCFSIANCSTHTRNKLLVHTKKEET